ncbi:MAG: hypothetical protein PHG08_00995 [Bacilli bacterium]|nr:hypothetical protein [Bacilli bacterium]
MNNQEIEQIENNYKDACEIYCNAYEDYMNNIINYKTFIQIKNFIMTCHNKLQDLKLAIKKESAKEEYDKACKLMHEAWIKSFTNDYRDYDLYLRFKSYRDHCFDEYLKIGG